MARLLQRADAEELHRHMGLGSLTLMGVGGTIGAGIFVLTGTAAAQYAGPAIAISFVIAGLACLLAGLCYAELASTIPIAGSAYTYAYASLGEVTAWVIGWNLVLEYMFAAAAVAIGWSGYFTALLADLGFVLPRALSGQGLSLSVQGGLHVSGGLNLPAAFALLFTAWILSLGGRKSTLFNALVVILKVGVILAVIGFGAPFVHLANWSPFIPDNTGVFGQFGWSGIVRGASVAFFAYIGFDMVSSSAQEVRNPRRNVPLGLFLTLAICTGLYVAMALTMTGLAPYRSLNVADPVFVAIRHAGAGLAWLRPLVSMGVVIGLFAAMFLCLFGQARIFYAMAKDGLIPGAFARLHATSKTPVFGVWCVGAASALIAAVTPLQLLGELVSIGTLMAFAMVCLGVLVLRKTDPDLPRAFRVPYVSVVATLGAGVCLYMMISLPPATWIRLIVWLAIGMAIYAVYGRRRSGLASPPAS